MAKSSYKNSNFYRKNLSSAFKQKQEKQENSVSLVFLILKICFSFLALISLFKLGYSSKLRLTRLKEIQDSFSYEKYRYNNLSSRFDDLFSAEGEQRFMKDQDQIISRDIIRVIWR
ncbi:hypothetical protein CU311_02915 [Prochlorococcus marinus str. MU1402]|uniref:hypothetical protein n=1 Tax=Prochlorococcus marinus TaxID=1219 RepID=UPI001ADA130E|nr:hypothetical protein [Prochlorococcus marinus]MBO8231597.1 hypothetical protein [Prochlorococcus marinus XMU1402]MBW3056356.1 hypothetical protein [Prochlorococcus marinus str. MU1402]